MGFEDFEPIFAEVNAEWESPNPLLPVVPHPYLFHVYASDSSHLKIQATDFQSYTWEATRSFHQMEDMRDYVGIGGPWSEFVDYFASSLKSQGVKLILEAHSKSNGAAFAKLVAQKSKGMPLITISLSKLTDVAAGEAMSKLALGLFRVSKDLRTSLVKEQERCCRLTRMMEAEKEKSESIKSQLSAFINPKRQKLASDDGNLSAVNSGSTTVIDSQKSTGNQLVSSKAQSGKVAVLPAHRRAKVRGAVINIDED